MELSPAEQDFYNLVFSKLTRDGLTLHNTECVSLVKRGIDDHQIRKQIWSRVFPSGSRGAISKENLFKLLKYIAAYQQGIQVDHATFQTLPIPNLPKMSEKTIAQKPIKNSDANSRIENEDGNQRERIPLKALSPNKIVVRQDDSIEAIAEDKQKAEHQQTGDITHNKENIDEEWESEFEMIEDENDLQNPNDENSISSENLDVTFDLLNVASSYDDYIEKAQVNRTKIQIVSIRSSSLIPLRFTNYIIKTEFPSESASVVEREYGDFVWFHSQLKNQVQYKGLIFPKLPKSGLLKDTTLLTRELVRYLKELGIHEIFHDSYLLRLFLSEKESQTFKELKEVEALKEHLSIIGLVQNYIKCLMIGPKIELKSKDFAFKEQGMGETIDYFFELKKFLQKKIRNLQNSLDSYKIKQNTSKLNKLYTDIMNRADNKCSSLASLAKMFIDEKNLHHKELVILESVVMDLQSIITRLEGFEASCLFYKGVLDNISTNEKTRENQQKQFAKYKNTQLLNPSSQIVREISSLEQVEKLCRGNLMSEIKTLSKECDELLPLIFEKLCQSKADGFKQLQEDLRRISHMKNYLGPNL